MVFDQQIAMGKAFRGPKDLADRTGSLNVHRIAEADPNELAAMVTQKPAIHRFPDSMAKRIQVLTQHVVDNYDGQVELIWTRGEPDGAEVPHHLQALPGFSDQNPAYFYAPLGKQMNPQADDRRDTSADCGKQGTFRSVADAT